MDQIKVGRFIASSRKEQGMTQVVLAEKLGVSDRAVSKWETGKSMPDTGIMMELCMLLNISVNDLLSGERIMTDTYDRKAEENLMILQRENEEMSRKMLKLEWFLMGISLTTFIVMLIFGLMISEKDSEVMLGMLLCFLAALLLVAASLVGVWIEKTAGYYECSECGHRYKPTYWQALFAPHWGRNRKMKCPRCGKRNYHKKVISGK